ncbi:MAG: WYL domain-containing protein [Synergistaceae bacterium]|nr:WYL domain-containing protein [Synergistaceae bacterium]
MPDKGSSWEHLVRLHTLVRFLVERGENGAALEEIRARVYPDEELKTEAFRKKFGRDRDALQKIYSPDGDDADGGDVVVEEKNGRYFLKSSYGFMLPMKVNDGEVQALITGARLAGHFVKPLGPSAESLWNKLKKQFSASSMLKGDRLSQAISFAMPVSEVDSGGHEAFQKVVQAIDGRKVLKVREYEDHDGKKAAYTISPYALYFKYHAWYLMGMCPERAPSPDSLLPAVFRLNRMRLVEILPDARFIPCPYSPEELRENIELDFHPANPGRMYHVKLRVTGSFARPVLETEWFRGEKKVKEVMPGGDFCVSYEVKLKGLERITLWIMRALDSIEVLEPRELKDEIDRRVAVYLKRTKERKS